MGKPKWKAGDTCTIKPKTSGISKYDWGKVWTVARVKPNGEVVVHNGAPGNIEGFAMEAFMTLRPSRLLPVGDASPNIAAQMGAEVLRLRARLAELEAANAELEATLANERGEGGPPCEGWEWEPEESGWSLWKDGGGFYVTRTPDGWTWDADRMRSGTPHFDTARDAIRAASGAA